MLDLTVEEGETLSIIGPSGAGKSVTLKTILGLVHPDSGEVWVDGQQMQNGNSGTMIFKPAYLVHYISQFMKLEAGDIITTGTPPGVGLGMKPPLYLKPGNVVRLSIDGLGQQEQKFVEYQKQ